MNRSRKDLGYMEGKQYLGRIIFRSHSEVHFVFLSRTRLDEFPTLSPWAYQVYYEACGERNQSLYNIVPFQTSIQTTIWLN